jgi:acetyl esterase
MSAPLRLRIRVETMVAYHRPDQDHVKALLHPQAQSVLEEIEAFAPQTSDLPSLEERRRLQQIEPRFSGDPQPVAATRDVQIDGPAGKVKVRLYFPDVPAPHAQVLFIHGGGWALGGIEFADALCRALCNASGMLIGSVDYRLAPEHRFPAGLEDAYAALQWLDANAAANGSTRAPIAVCGDSAGGNLSAAVALLSRDRAGPPIALQVLIYPALDPTLSRPSMTTCATGYGLTRDDMHMFWDLYLRAPQDAADPYASPPRAKFLKGLPPALIVTAEFDPLVDEGEAYGAQLQADGVKATVTRYPGMIHGFIDYLGRVDAARAAVAECADALKAAMRERFPAS